MDRESFGGVRFCECWQKSALSHKAFAKVMRPLKDLQCNSVSFTKECDQKHQFTRAWYRVRAFQSTGFHSGLKNGLGGKF